ncbi:MAG: hypothetical protein SGI86_19335 [Deltaproteobacteria bacterium]|nr:hypothetical protein [Deltaproteobacteria bacterium]
MSNAWCRCALGLSAVFVLAAASCDSDPPAPASTGSVSLALTANTGGVIYRLRNARFVISNGSTVLQTLDSETDPDATFLSATIAIGSYSINLESGWALERTDTGTVIDATLISPNPTAFQIFAGSTTTVTYRFSTSLGVITIGTGTLRVGIEVTVVGDAGIPEGETGGCLVTGCAAGLVCQQFSTETGTTSMCILSCDPVTQIRSDGAAACGSPDPLNPTMGCYGVNGVYSCARAPFSSKNHGDPAASSTGVVYLNACSPGNQPFFFASSTDPTSLCTAFCRPAPTFVGMTANADGIGPYGCSDRGAPAGTECRYLSGFVSSESPASNDIGVCYEPSRYTYDNDFNAATPSVPVPRCADLAFGDTNGNGLSDYIEWGCGPQP